MSNNLLTTLQRTAGKTGLMLRKHSPEIMIVASAIGTVAATVMACKATVKAIDIVEEHKEAVEEIKEIYAEDMEDAEAVQEYKKELTVKYAKTAVKLAKLYAPAVVLGGLSLSTAFASNNILRKRNGALTAAYTALDGAFKTYRKNVVDEYGEQVDKNMRYSIKRQKVNVIETDEDGNDVLIEKEVDVTGLDPNQYSAYARFFDSTSREWTKEPEYNLSFLMAQQEYATHRLKSRGYLFLNEVYTALDIPITQAGQYVGWIWDGENNDGDGFVDFGIMELYRPETRRFVNGYEPIILLDFNVDGNIIDKI